tara:strand:+ start:3160 stop:3729 length:570 start_codon:yes stop_codon:yes gene_type:complete
MWNRTLLPERHKSAAKEVYDQADRDSMWFVTLEYLTNRVCNKGSIFILTGKRGVGKTQMAACLARLVCLGQRDAHYLRAADLYLCIKSTFDGDGSETGLINQWSVKPTGSNNGCQLLIIDELHDRSGSNWEDRILNQIVDRRYGNCLDTVLITNETRPNIAKTIGPSIVSRADETGGIIECLWDSFRSP